MASCPYHDRLTPSWLSSSLDERFMRFRTTSMMHPVAEANQGEFSYRNDLHLAWLAGSGWHYRELRRVYHEELNRDIVGAFRTAGAGRDRDRARRDPRLLPLLHEDASIEAQTAGHRHAPAALRTLPEGFWLPGRLPPALELTAEDDPAPNGRTWLRKGEQLLSERAGLLHRSHPSSAAARRSRISAARTPSASSGADQPQAQ